MPSIHDLVTPALLIDTTALDHNLRTMAAALPGDVGQKSEGLSIAVEQVTGRRG